MKNPTPTSILSILFLTNIQTCLAQMEALNAIATAISITSGIIGTGQFLWDLDHGENIMKDIKNNEIYQEIQLMNTDTHTILSDIPEQAVVRANKQAFEQKINDLENFYKDMVDYNRTHQNQSSIAKDQMLKISYDMLRHSSNGPIKLMNDVMNLLAFGSLNILDKIREKSFKYSSTCSTEKSKRSLQATLYNYLRMIQFAELKVFFMLNIASNILYYHEPQNSVNINSSYCGMIDNLKLNHEKMIQKFKSVLPDTSRNVWRCDPEPHNYREDFAYTRLKYVFRGHIVNERDLEESKKFSCSLWPKCGSVNPNKEYSCKTDNIKKAGQFDFWNTTACLYQRKCNGLLWNCHEMVSKWTSILEICLTNKVTDRSYDFVELYTLTEKKRYGYRNSCEGSLVAEDSTFKKFEFCFSCFCICDDKVDDYSTLFNRVLSERLFYTKSVEADVNNNYVITGVRFRKELNVIYIQIQQAKLLENGHIDKSTLHWKNESHSDLMNPANHYRIHWKAKSIELQDIDLPFERVLVGLKFENMTKDGVERLRLVALSQPFNYNSGKVAPKGKKFNQTRTNLSNNGISTNNLRLPDDSIQNPVIVTNKYISFGVSNLESDVGQTTIPFLDIQEVVKNKPFPMGGIGIYYRKSHDPNIAGFIGLKLKTYDVSKHV